MIFNPVLPTQFKPQLYAEAFFFIIIYCASLKSALFISIRRKSKNGCSFKTQIKQAIESIFNVKVESVNTINVKPKKKRVGRYMGKTSKVKKAIVKLKEGSSIELN